MRALVVPEWVLYLAAAYALASAVFSTLRILQSRREIALNRELVAVLKGRSREVAAIGPLTTLPEITTAVSAISRDLGAVLGELEGRCGIRWAEESPSDWKATPHAFQGRSDRDCERCGLPDRARIHSIPTGESFPG